MGAITIIVVFNIIILIVAITIIVTIIVTIIIAVVIFFIPTIVGLVLGLISNFSESGAKDDWNTCRSCITDPNSPECGEYADEAWKGGVQ